MTLLAFFLAGITTMYYSFRSDINFLLVKQDVVHEILWRTAFYIHITGGILALTIGPLQLLKRSRTKKYRPVHRALGKTYIIAILGLAAPSGFYMALFAEGGPWASTGFAIMAMLWFFTTWQAYTFARERNFKEHGKWMVRSYALTFSAVTLRLWVPVASIYFGMQPSFVITLSAWTSWMINIAVAELLLAMNRRLKPAVAQSVSSTSLA